MARCARDKFSNRPKLPHGCVLRRLGSSLPALLTPCHAKFWSRSIHAHTFGKQYNCAKSKKIVDQTAAFILEHGGPEGGITGALEALFLMSTGEEKYKSAVEKYAVELASKGCGTSTWMIGYSGIFLGEYYLATRPVLNKAAVTSVDSDPE